MSIYISNETYDHMTGELVALVEEVAGTGDTTDLAERVRLALASADVWSYRVRDDLALRERVDISWVALGSRRERA